MCGRGWSSRGSSPASTAARITASRSSSPRTANTRRATTCGTSTGRSGRKTDRLYIKEYEEETNLKCTILLDASKSMRYGARGAGAKFDYAATAAASLAYLLQQQQDAVGLVTFNTKVAEEPAGQLASQPSEADAARAGADAARRQDRRGAASFPELARQIRRRGMIVLFSDLFLPIPTLAEVAQAVPPAAARGDRVPRDARRRADVSRSRTTRCSAAWKTAVQLHAEPRALRRSVSGSGRAVPGRSAQDLCERRRRLRADEHQGAARRRAGQLPGVPAEGAPHGATRTRASSQLAAMRYACRYDMHLLNSNRSPPGWSTRGSSSAGLLAISLPILIHLLNKRKFQIVDWAAMDFLLDADKKNRRRIRLENLILLLLRCLAVLLIGLLAGPAVLADERHGRPDRCGPVRADRAARRFAQHAGPPGQ